MASNGIVVGVDGSDASNSALEWAVAEALLRNAPLTLAHAYQDMPVAVGDAPAPLPLPREEIDAAVRAILDDAAATAQRIAAGADLDLREVHAYGSPGPALAELSADADLVVVGSRGHGRLAELLLGSTATHCVRHCVCPVVVTPHARPAPPKA